MRLCYRGVEYDYHPPSLEVKEGEILGKYRGRPLHFNYVSHVPIPQPVADLTYRGVSYRTTALGQVRPGVRSAEQPRQSVFQAIKSSDNSMMQARRHLLKEAAESHRDNIQRILQHRIEVARAQGNDTLLKQLEEEMHQLA
jgi:hypothetical protein